MGDLSIQDAIAMRVVMEEEIEAFVAGRLADFKKATGLQVQGMSVEAVEITRIESRQRDVTIGRFSVEINL